MSSPQHEFGANKDPMRAATGKAAIIGVSSTRSRWVLQLEAFDNLLDFIVHDESMNR